MKASEMPKTPSQPSSEKAKELAHKKVEERKRTLLKKLKAGESPEDVSNAKARLQIDRVEANRQDYLDEQKKKPEKRPEEKTH